MTWCYNKDINSKPDTLTAWIMQLEGRSIYQCRKQSCELCFSLLLIFFWSFAVSKAKILCKKWSTVNTGYSSSSRASEDSAGVRMVVVLCARSLSKLCLLNIIFKGYVLSNRNAFNGSSHPFLLTFITPFPPPQSVKTTMLGINYPKPLTHQQYSQL